jgi:hypothetical protein
LPVGVGVAGARIDFPSFGISVPVPPGLVRDTDTMNSVVIFVPPGQVHTASPARTVLIDQVPKGGLSVRQHAEAMAGTEGLKVASESARWGGLPAVELLGGEDKVQRKLATRRAMLVEREGYLYRVMFASNSAEAADLAAFRAVVEGTRWLKTQPAGRGVAGGAILMVGPPGIAFTVPDPFRPNFASRGKHVLTFLAFDLPSRKAAAQLMVLPFADADPKRTLKSMGAEVERELGPSWQLKGPLRWTEERGAVSFATAAQEAGKDSRVEVLVALRPDGRATVFTLLYPHGPAAEGMERALGLIKATIRPAPPRTRQPATPAGPAVDDRTLRT